ncbi:MAG: MerR family transcriptional regulator [Alphaproteobacteria bacterium]|nr:MerR family transcriptional regulator [Alphaproteobacteria bacterium]
MQLNFLQEDLLELMQQDKPAAPAVVLQRTAQKKPEAPVQISLLPEAPPPAKKKPSSAATQVSHLPEEKSPAAFKTISEAAEILGVPAYVLRFWESQFPQIHPTKSRGGRRYYRPEDMEVLTSIKDLLYKEGYTIKGARKAFSQIKQDVALADTPVAVQGSVPKKPIITPKQKSQLSAIRSELLTLKEQLAPYL